MTISSDDPRYIFMPEKDILQSRGMVNAIHNAWWCVHKEHGLRFWQGVPDRVRTRSLTGASPQCNSNKEIVERLLIHDTDEVKQIPLVLAPINVNDYGR